MTTDEKFMMNKIISENLFNLCRLCNSFFNVPNYQHYDTLSKFPARNFRIFPIGIPRRRA